MITMLLFFLMAMEMINVFTLTELVNGILYFNLEHNDIIFGFIDVLCNRNILRWP